MFKKILIANRGDTAIRIMRTCKEMGIETVAVHSTADANAMHVLLADEAVCIGGNSPAESYLKKTNIISAALITGCDAIHPGIGFLSENAEFAAMVEEQDLIFIGPTSEHIQVMGDKITAKETALRLGIPVVPGSEGAISDFNEALKVAKETGFPLIIKAASGGGGRGMKVAYKEEEVEEALSLCRAEAKAAFGDDAVYIERYLGNPRHIEVQLLADGKGHCVHLGERDCSVQRRHQKVVEEAPSPAITPEQREKIGKTVCDAMAELKYRGVGTVEFLYEDGEFFFIEMNTRLQVEHTISEEVTGIDLVREQLKVAAGNTLEIKQEDIVIKGHAIECRITAENPENFIPTPGTVEQYLAPGGFGVRVDSHIYPGYKIPPFYDSLIGKLIVKGNDRAEAISRTRRCLEEYVIDGAGVHTIIPLHQDIFRQDAFISGEYNIHWLEKHLGMK